MRPEKTSRRVLLSAGITLAAPAALAQAYPARPIRIIVSYAAGGGYDITARFLAEALTRDLGQPVIVENRTGGGGILGMEQVWRAASDGYTVGLTGAALLTTVPHLRRLPYEPLNFAHVTRLVSMPYVLAVRNDLPARSIPEFIELARGGQLNYGSSGAGTSQHLAAELFMQSAGIRMTLVTYRGTSLALNDLAAGTVDAVLADVTAAEMVRSGRVRAMAVIAERRWSLLPDVPIAAEVMPECKAENWYGLSAPPGTPPEIVEFLNTRIERLFADPALRARYDAAGLHPALLSGASLQDFIRRDYDTWGRVVQRGNIRMDS